MLTALCFGAVLAPAFAQTPANLYTAGRDVLPGIGTTLGNPAGGFYDGTYFWVADRSADLSRLTPVSGVLPKMALDFLNLFPNSGITLSNLQIGGPSGLAGQPDFNPLTGMGYVPQARSGRTGKGLVRFLINGNLSTQAAAIATPANLKSAKLSASVLGPDGQLYLSSSGSDTILRIANPHVGTSQSVQTIGKSLGGKPVNGLAFLGKDLFLAQAGGLTRISSATACITGCQAQTVPGSAAGQTYWAIAADPDKRVIYTAKDAQVVTYTLATESEELLSNTGTYPDGSLQGFKFSASGAGLTLASVNGVPTLWIGDNVGNGLAFEGRVWTLPLTGTENPPEADLIPPDLKLPADVRAEAVSAAGAVVNYPPATATDAVSGSVPVTCSPASGSAFAMGANTVNCSAVDLAGNKASGAFTVTVADTIAPILQLPQGLSAEAPNATDGAVVTFAASASDTISGSVAVSCVPASGSTFAVGTTTVNCSAADGAGNVAQGSFPVEVTSPVVLVDSTPPVLSLPADISVDATSSAGAIVKYSVSALDDVSGAVAVSCAPISGSTFPVDTTVVNCSAADAAGNVANGSFSVTVVAPVVIPEDTTPPVLKVPADISVPATSSAGALVTYSVSANDAVSGPVTPVCNPVSGSLFAVGSTTVACQATDAAGNTAYKSFVINVTPQPAAGTADLGVSFATSLRSPLVGQNVTISYTVTNAGPGSASSTVFSDRLSNLLQIRSVTTTLGTCAAPIGALGGQVSCSLGTMAAGRTATITMNVTAAVAGNATNTGVVTSTTADSNTSNNSGTFFMTIR